MRVNYHRCLRCGYEWISQGDEPPVKCPSCRTKRWDVVWAVQPVKPRADKPAKEG